MMKSALLPFLLLLSLCVSAQKNAATNTIQPPPSELKPLSTEEILGLKELPELSIPLSYKGKNLPAVVDNSTQPYMREVFQQSGLSCGQAAGVAYNYTYEIDRLRNLPANINDNLYPTHFTWNWMHGGNGWYGVSYLHSFQVLRHCGNVNVTDYGGSLAYGGSERWMSGYNNYYNGMANRISGIYRINVGTPEGLETFKHWINDHLDGSAVGGVGSFYSQYMSASNTLPAGTPEAGKYVLTFFGGSPNHAQTIVGYNDSIRWDYNNDGQYTNHIDINGDGVVDMKDWEIGGFKMVQSYGGVPNWGDQGYAYMMYKTVADKLGQGGIWNHSVHVIYAKEECHPQATMKVILSHDSRNKIKVVAGLSNNPAATSPHYIMEFPIFNYQGGYQYMQGGTSDPSHKTIEFGLDISPLLSHVALNQTVKLFLQVFEYDPDNSGNGSIINFSVFDYTNGINETPCPQSNVPINNNDLTTMSLLTSFSFDRVHIVNTALPPATIGQPYTHQLTAAGGEAPWSFKLLKQYGEQSSTEGFQNVNAQQLSPSNTSSGFVTKQLDFDFPYYDSVYSSVTMHVDGYLMFDEQLYPYPYFKDDMVLFRITRHISPLMCHAMRLYSSNYDGLWYEGNSDYATFRWKASIDGNTSTTLNFSVTLYPSGDIDFNYGNINIGEEILWISGLCDGNEDDMQFSDFYFNHLPDPDSKYAYSRYDYPEGLSVSPEGLITGTVQQSVNGEVLSFKVTDNNFVHSTKALAFSTTGITITDSISAGGDQVIDYGEMVNQSVTLTNLESDPVNNASITIEINNPYVTMIDDYEYIGTLPVGQPVELINAFSFKIASDIPNEEIINIETTINGSSQVWENTLIHTAYAPVPEIVEIIVLDGNNQRLDPGETADLEIRLKNSGGSKAVNLACLLFSSDQYITLNQDSAYVPLLAVDSTRILTYNISVDPNAPIGHLASFNIEMDGLMGFEAILPFDLMIGLTIEDYETGAFDLFTWGFKGNRDWKIDNIHAFEGVYCARSGNIGHEQSSSMVMDLDILEAGDIGFYRKVSCEDAVNNDHDYLAFYIDDVEMARWDSILDWEEVNFPVGQGYHRLEWRYSKNASISSGLDAAFIDFISLPACIDAMPGLTCAPLAFDKSMLPDTQDTDTLLLSNAGMGEVEFEIVITDVTKEDNGSRSIAGSYLECEQEEFHTGEPFSWNFTLYNGSDDNEWLQELSIKVPDGVNVTIATPFTGGSGGNLAFTGGLGNGKLLTWYGEDASGWGVVQGGEYAYGSFSGNIETAFAGNILLDYTITGDIYGSEPHVIEGQLVIENLGANINWLSLDINEGLVAGQDEQMVMLSFNTQGLEDGNYYCNIIMRDNFQHETIIPVHLLVDTDLGIQQQTDQEAELNVFPNPFDDNINIRLSLPETVTTTIRIIDIKGKLVAKLLHEEVLSAGIHTLNWKAPETQMQSGVYLIMVECDNNKLIKKLIKN